MRQFSVTDAQGSLMFALSNISGFIASYACRYLLRHYDRLTLLRAGAIGLTLSLWGLSSALWFWLFLFFSFGFGLSLGILGLIPNILVPLGSSSERKQRLLSGLHMMYGLSSLLAPLLAAAVEHLTGSWRWTFAVASLAPISLLLYSFHSSHHSLHTKSQISDEDRRAHRQRNLRPQLYLAVMLSFAVAAEIMVSSRLALYMQREWNFPMEKASLYVTYFFVAMMLGRMLFALIHFKHSARFHLSGSLITTAVLLLLGLYGHPLFLALTGFTIAPFYPLAISWISSEFPQDLDSAVSYMMTTDSLMLIVMHVVIGKLTDFFGIHNALLMGLFFLSASFALIHSYDWIFEKKEKLG
ncbi:MAG: MFS transporter [Bdellovibrio sp.]